MDSKSETEMVAMTIMIGRMLNDYPHEQRGAILICLMAAWLGKIPEERRGHHFGRFVAEMLEILDDLDKEEAVH